jgi:hypothetical protein
MEQTHLITFAHDTLKLEISVSATVAETIKITGKSITSLRNLISTLRLPEEVQTALETGVLPLSQGYIFVENIGHPKLLDIQDECPGRLEDAQQLCGDGQKPPDVVVVADAANRSRLWLMDILRVPGAGPESDVFRRDLLFRRQESPDPQAGRKPVALI